MHQITGFYFTGKYVFYSTKYAHARYMSCHDRTGLTDEQAKGKFIIEHNREVDYLIAQKRENSKIILNP
jgi:hypothetical protein